MKNEKVDLMKLLYITNGITGSGGLERVLSVKASYLADNYKYEVHILSLNEEGKEPFYKFSSQIIFHTLSYTGIYSYIKGIIRSVKKIQPDIISVCDDGLKGFLLPIILRKPCPMIYERHVSKEISRQTGKLGSIKTSILYKLMHIGGRLYNRFIVLTERNKLEWKLSNIEVIANPLPFYPEVISELKNKKVINVGKLSYQKAQDILIEIWERVSKAHDDWTLDIYGKNEKKSSYHDLIIEKNLESNVFIHDPVKMIDEKYQESSIFVLTSRFEGFGMVLIEAMAYGIPCISFDCPYGPADIITNGEDGFLVSVGDIQQLADRIIYLIENEDKRIEMGQNARTKAEKYLPESIVPLWDDLFKELIDEKNNNNFS
ncbi:glycosyltransferase family 4 protein [Dysgonomonas sp. 511]|uniref:glycosyltransferase family 4 protein n=1 Tax=Dysgonomonas sp. 511 TaxID=2302930 RepID=UPI0013D3090D|nr:glycosyltransferase family 4 protein [Dysgonomonas sp. 511]NDV78858.1 glycosyltransferase family 4 protein [Dysgonomonas sp. 511]